MHAAGFSLLRGLLLIWGGWVRTWGTGLLLKVFKGSRR